MKIVPLVLATAVAAVLGSAAVFAQSPNTQSGNSAQSGSEMNAPTHPGANRWNRDRDWYGRPGWQQGAPGYGRMGPWMMGPRAGWMMGERPGWMGRQAAWRRFQHGPRGAHFHFQRGNARIDIQCPGNQPVKDCVDAASTLIDKVAHMGPPPPPPPGGPKPPARTNGSGATPGAATPGGAAPNSNPDNRM